MIRKLSLGMLLAAMLATVSLSRPLINVSISPTNTIVRVGMDQTFNATVTGSMMTSAVTWTINGIPGGNINTVGSIDAAGHYLAPAATPPTYMVTLKATSVEDTNASAQTTIYVLNKKPTIAGLSNWQIPLGPFTISVTGNNYMNGATINWNGSPLQTTYMSGNALKATGNAMANGNVQITVANPGPGAVSDPTTLVVGSGGGTGCSPNCPPPQVQVTVTVSPANPTIQLGATQQFQATVTNAADTSVTWKVNSTTGGQPTYGFIDVNGLYTAPALPPVSGVVTITAVSNADNTKSGSTFLTMSDPNILSQVRFLDQATFGPSPKSIAYLKQIGMQAWLDEQFQLPESPFPMGSKSVAQDTFFNNFMNAPDQLRQRVIYALSEVIVIALNKNTNGDEIIPWLQILSKNAFGNYRTLLREISTDASMGHFLDLANSGVWGGAANENYPREIMQLFSIGLKMLNNNGSDQKDANNNTIPTYTQFDVAQLAKAMTGWTYDNVQHVPPGGGYYAGPMVTYWNGHNKQSKTVLGVMIPANQTVQKDMDDAIDIIFNHPNVGPFIATRLIRALVTSNPSPAYIDAVASKFNNNGNGVRGDMKAVIQEILMNPEARNDNVPANFGRLRTPVQFLTAIGRAMNWGYGGASGFAYLMYGMNEGILDPNSVFGHYSPMFRIPNGGGLFGPEFQIYSASDAVNRANFLYQKLYVYPYNPQILPFINIAANNNVLANAVDNTLLFGRMSQATKNAITSSLSSMPDTNQKAINAIYLAAITGEFQVQR